MTTSVQDFNEQLKRQLVFLRNSAACYDAGDVEEAVRLGVVMRVLFHDTGVSTSLLKHLGQKEALKLVTTAKSVPPRLLEDLDFGEFMAGMTFGSDLTYNAVPPDSPTIPCPEWWNQPVFVRDRVPYTRKDVVLSAANKDGGAHVATPDARLRAFQESFWIKTQANADGTKTTVPLVNNHFRMLRRFAAELLCSEELLGLA